VFAQDKDNGAATNTLSQEEISRYLPWQFLEVRSPPLPLIRP
jgi:hypothetical protein